MLYSWHSLSHAVLTAISISGSVDVMLQKVGSVIDPFVDVFMILVQIRPRRMNSECAAV